VRGALHGLGLAHGAADGRRRGVGEEDQLDRARRVAFEQIIRSPDRPLPALAKRLDEHVALIDPHPRT